MYFCYKIYVSNNLAVDLFILVLFLIVLKNSINLVHIKIIYFQIIIK